MANAVKRDLAKRLGALGRTALRSVRWLLASESLASENAVRRASAWETLETFVRSEPLPFDPEQPSRRRGALGWLLAKDDLGRTAPPDPDRRPRLLGNVFAREELPDEAPVARRPWAAIRWLFAAETLEEPRPQDSDTKT